jgi:Planctomycete cytochrome C
MERTDSILLTCYLDWCEPSTLYVRFQNSSVGRMGNPSGFKRTDCPSVLQSSVRYHRDRFEKSISEPGPGTDFMPRQLVGLLTLSVIPLGFLGIARGQDQKAAEDRTFFEKRVWPVFQKNCLLCHGGAKIRNGLEVTSREALLRGGESGPAISPGNPERSLLIQAVRHQGRFHMPPKGKLPAETVADLVEWVKRGAPWSAR